MSKRTPNHIPGQESLFIQDPQTREEITSAPPEILAASETPHPTPIGPSVDIRGRSANLGQALITFGKMSQSTGFQKASDPQNRNLRRDLETRYGGGLD